MQQYIQSLGQNNDMTVEWEQARLTTYKFDPAKNYYHELLQHEFQENKRSQNPIPDSEFPSFLSDRIFNFKQSPRLENVTTSQVCGRTLYFGTCPQCCRTQRGGFFGPGHCANVECSRELTPEEMKYRVYNEWLSHKYKHFKNNWKPKSDDGLGYMWLTINFAPDVTVSEAKLHAAAIFNLKVFARSKISYCYEYNTEQGSHIHIHALIELNHTGKVSFSALKDDILKAKSRQGKMNIYLKMSWAKKYADRCDNRIKYNAYLSGNKTEEKLDNIEKDKIWRKENNLEEIYIKENN